MGRQATDQAAAAIGVPPRPRLEALGAVANRTGLAQTAPRQLRVARPVRQRAAGRRREAPVVLGQAARDGPGLPGARRAPDGGRQVLGVGSLARAPPRRAPVRRAAKRARPDGLPADAARALDAVQAVAEAAGGAGLSVGLRPADPPGGRRVPNGRPAVGLAYVPAATRRWLTRVLDSPYSLYLLL